MVISRTACALAPLLALAAGAVPARAQAVKQLPITLAAFSSPIRMDTLAVSTELQAVKGRVFTAAIKVLGEYGVRLDTRDSAAGVVGAKRYVKSSYLGNVPMSRVLNCGNSITGPNADNFRIEMAVIAFVEPTDSTHTKLGVALVGSGTDMRGNASDPVACASTGVLEGDFARRVGKILTSP